MGFVLDAFLKKDLFTDEFIIADFYSDVIDVSNVEEAFILQLEFAQEGPDAIIGYASLEASGDGITYAPYDQGIIHFNDSDGTFIWDVQNSGANFIKLFIKVDQGNIRATCRYSGKRRH
jgi:hypothetical protein